MTVRCRTVRCPPSATWLRLVTGPTTERPVATGGEAFLPFLDDGPVTDNPR